MAYRYLNLTVQDLDEKIVLIDAWFDRETRSWVIQSKNEAGDQIGESTYVGTRMDAKHDVSARRSAEPTAKVKWSS